MLHKVTHFLFILVTTAMKNDRMFIEKKKNLNLPRIHQSKKISERKNVKSAAAENVGKIETDQILRNISPFNRIN